MESQRENGYHEGEAAEPKVVFCMANPFSHPLVRGSIEPILRAFSLVCVIGLFSSFTVAASSTTSNAKTKSPSSLNRAFVRDLDSRETQENTDRLGIDKLWIEGLTEERSLASQIRGAFSADPYNDFSTANHLVLPGYDTRLLSVLFGFKLEDVPLAAEEITADDLPEVTASLPHEPSEKNDIVHVQILTKKSQDKSDEHLTKICWYFDGMVVSVPLREKDVRQESTFQVGNFSSAVDEQSLVIKSPDSAIVHSYQLVPDDQPSSLSQQLLPSAKEDEQNAPSLTQPSPNPLPQHLELAVSEPVPVDDDAEWWIQYNARRVSWHANHVIEMARDRQHVSFTTLFHVQNLSGISFQKALVWFIDKKLPASESEPASITSSASAYRYPLHIDLAPYQKKVIVWNSAKRIAVKNSNGLFVGGDYLAKMDQKAFPRVENWITFKNAKAEGLGCPLPGGQVAVYGARHGFSVLGGYTRMNSVQNGEEVTISLPPFTHQYAAKKKDDDEGSLDATLIQESYRVLTPTVTETEYRLVLKNTQNEASAITVTLDTNKKIMYQVLRSNVTYERNERGEAVWNMTVPPRGNRELRYKLALRQRN